MDDRILPGFSERTLPVGTAVASRCARLHVPDPRADGDAPIAATALAGPASQLASGAAFALA